jgi:hypothetical protein
VAHGPFDRERAHGDKIPGIPDQHRLDVLGPVDQERVDWSGDEANDIAVFADQVLQRLKWVAGIGTERPQQLQAAWSWGQRLRTDCR